MKKKTSRPASVVRFVVVNDNVWCDKHGVIHDDTLDPYDYGSREDMCKPEDHVPVYVVKR